MFIVRNTIMVELQLNRFPKGEIKKGISKKCGIIQDNQEGKAQMLSCPTI